MTIAKYANITVKPEEITKKANEALANYVDTGDVNRRKVIDESSLRQQAAFNAIAIQDLVKWLNGSDLKEILKILKIISCDNKKKCHQIS